MLSTSSNHVNGKQLDPPIEDGAWLQLQAKPNAVDELEDGPSP